MIKLKARPPIPPTLTSEVVLSFVENLQKRVKSGEDLKAADFEGKYWRKGDVKKALFEMHYNGKCCYCERRRDEKRELDVEHFRPKAKVTGVRDHPGYWWLAYEWDNYFYSCKKCNEDHKINLFPLLDETLRVYNEDVDLSSESPFLINPELENPEDFIGWEWYKAYGVLVKAVGEDGQGRGAKTIQITGLNEGNLPIERAELVRHLGHIAETMLWAKRSGIERTIESTAKEIYFETQSERIFAGFRRDFFRGMSLGEYVAND